MRTNYWMAWFCCAVAAIPQGHWLGQIAGGLCGVMAVLHAYEAGKKS